jgi:hypothetical protein
MTRFVVCILVLISVNFYWIYVNRRKLLIRVLESPTVRLRF